MTVTVGYYVGGQSLGRKWAASATPEEIELVLAFAAEHVEESSQHPFGWGAEFVLALIGHDAFREDVEAFWLAAIDEHYPSREQAAGFIDAAVAVAGGD